MPVAQLGVENNIDWPSIDTIVAINKPSSKMSMKSIEGFINIETFERVLPIRAHL